MNQLPVRRFIDNCGRVVLPREACRLAGIAPGAPVSIVYEDGKIVITGEKLVHSTENRVIPDVYEMISYKRCFIRRARGNTVG